MYMMYCYFVLGPLRQKKYQNNFYNSTCLKISNLSHPYKIFMDFKMDVLE